MMLGPQVRFLENKMKGIAGDKPVTEMCIRDSCYTGSVSFDEKFIIYMECSCLTDEKVCYTIQKDTEVKT